MIDGLNAIFITLLKADPNNPGFELTESADGQEIIFKTKAELGEPFLEKLKEIFKSHGHTLASIAYRLNVRANNAAGAAASAVAGAAAAASAQSPEQPFPKVDFPLLEMAHLNGNEIFARLFDTKFRESIGNIMQWQETQGQNNQTVYYYVCHSPADVALRTAQVEIFKTVLSQASWSDLYHAFAKNNPQPLPSNNAYGAMGNGPLRAQLDSLFTVRPEGNKSVVRFDCLGLASCVVAPSFALAGKPVAAAAAAAAAADAGDAGFSEIRFNKRHFMAYMSTLLNDGIFMYDQGDNRLLPVVVNRGRAIQQNTLIEFGIDCSSSMGQFINQETVFATLKKTLKDILSKMPQYLDRHATIIRLSRFGSQSTKYPVIEMSLNKVEELLKEIESPYFNYGANEQTALHQFLFEQANACSSARYANYNIVRVLISDGGDNDSPGSTLEKLSVVLSGMGEAMAPPQYFSIEIGNLSEEILALIQKTVEGTRITVERGASLDPFYRYLNSLGLSRYFLHFVQEARRFRLPVIDGKIAFADPKNYIVPGQPFVMNDVTYVADKQDLSRQSTLLQGQGGGSDERKMHDEQMQALKREMLQAREAHEAKIAALQAEFRREQEQSQAQNHRESEEQKRLIRDAEAAMQQLRQTLEDERRAVQDERKAAAEKAAASAEKEAGVQAARQREVEEMAAIRADMQAMRQALQEAQAAAAQKAAAVVAAAPNESYFSAPDNSASGSAAVRPASASAPAAIVPAFAGQAAAQQPLSAVAAAVPAATPASKLPAPPEEKSSSSCVLQ